MKMLFREIKTFKTLATHLHRVFKDKNAMARNSSPLLYLVSPTRPCRLLFSHFQLYIKLLSALREFWVNVVLTWLESMIFLSDFWGEFDLFSSWFRFSWCVRRTVFRDFFSFFFYVWSWGGRRSSAFTRVDGKAACACGQFLFLFASLRSKPIDSSDLVRIKGGVRRFPWRSASASHSNEASYTTLAVVTAMKNQ